MQEVFEIRHWERISDRDQLLCTWYWRTNNRYFRKAELYDDMAVRISEQDYISAYESYINA